MMKKVYLNENDLTKMIHESIKKILTLKESHALKQPYYNLIQAIEDFQNVLEVEYDMNDESIKRVYAALKNAESEVSDLVRHPEGRNGDMKVWDRVGF